MLMDDCRITRMLLLLLLLIFCSVVIETPSLNLSLVHGTCTAKLHTHPCKFIIIIITTTYHVEFPTANACGRRSRKRKVPKLGLAMVVMRDEKCILVTEGGLLGPEIWRHNYIQELAILVFMKLCRQMITRWLYITRLSTFLTPWDYSYQVLLKLANGLGDL